MAESWSFRRVIQHVYEAQSTGVLRVTGEGVAVAIHLDSGAITDVVDDFDATSFTEYVQASGLLSRRQLQRLRGKADKSGRDLDDYLVHSEVLSEGVLARYLELNMRELLLTLFERSELTCELRTMAPQKNLWVGPQPIPWLLKESKRRLEAWPTLRKRIPKPAIIFDKVNKHIFTVLGQGYVPLAEAADGGSQNTPRAHFSAAERSAFYFANGKKTVEQIRFASGTSAFDTYSALVSLFDAGYIQVAADSGTGERTRGGLAILKPVFQFACWCMVGAAVYGLVQMQPDPLASIRQVTVADEQLWERIQSKSMQEQHQRVREIVFLRTGRYPHNTKEISAAGVVAPPFVTKDSSAPSPEDSTPPKGLSSGD